MMQAQQPQLTLKPLHNGIVFKFEESVAKGAFHELSDGGIILGGNFVESAKEKHRWGTVLFVGPKCTQIKPGMRVLIKSHQWTTEFKVPGFENEGQLWKTDEDQILGIDPESEV